MDHLVRPSAIAIIPARGGSKRIPRKNIIPFAGKPLVAHTIAAALNCGRFDQVVVSTDDEEIADVARKWGAAVPFLRVEHADDHAPVSLAVISALDQAEQHFGQKYERVVQLMANCPLRSADDISTALDHFEDNDLSFQISCFAFGWMNPWWAVELAPGGRPSRLFEDQLSRRSQDLPELFCPTGAIWVAKSAELRAAGTYYGPDHRFLPMSWEAAVDIDDYDDLRMAEAVHAARTTR